MLDYTTRFFDFFFRLKTFFHSFPSSPIVGSSSCSTVGSSLITTLKCLHDNTVFKIALKGEDGTLKCIGRKIPCNLMMLTEKSCQLSGKSHSKEKFEFVIIGNEIPEHQFNNFLFNRTFIIDLFTLKTSLGQCTISLKTRHNPEL